MNFNQIYYGFLALLQTLLVWPFVILVIFFACLKPIKKLIDEISELDWGGRKLTRKNSQEALPNESPIIDDSKNEADEYKIAFLNNFLTQNSIEALRWFNTHEGKHSFAEFDSNYNLVDTTTRTPEDEKMFIIKALEDTNLLSKTKSPLNDQFEITEEGTSYLKYKNLI